jgi:hypothetical protein
MRRFDKPQIHDSKTLGVIMKGKKVDTPNSKKKIYMAGGLLPSAMRYALCLSSVRLLKEDALRFYLTGQ